MSLARVHVPWKYAFMTFDDQLDLALRSSDRFTETRSLAMQLLKAGYAKSTVLELLEQSRQRLRDANREADEDVVMDVMDQLVGWCSPHAKL